MVAFIYKFEYWSNYPIETESFDCKKFSDICYRVQGIDVLFLRVFLTKRFEFLKRRLTYLNVNGYDSFERGSTYFAEYVQLWQNR